MKQAISIIVAFDLNRGMGKNNKLPWHLPGDFKHFREVTTEAEAGKNNAVVMGRKTWESISEKHKPLINRLNVVLTKQPKYDLPQEVLSFSSLESSIDALSKLAVDKCFVIGGGEIYRAAFDNPRCNQIYATEIEQVFDCDTFFPEIPPQFKLITNEVHEENGIKYSFKLYKL